MKYKTSSVRRVISLLVLTAMLVSFVPLSINAAGATDDNYHRVVDTNTMDNWKHYFDLNNLDTSNAGGVWTDKSVFTDASAFPSSVTMIDSNKNFLTALSAIAANKEIVGYSTVPTDTVFVLDLSGSMSVASVTQLVNATNEAIKNLQDTNKNNRVGVVLYSGSSSTRTYDNAVASLMPIDRYTTGSDGRYIVYNGSTVYLDSDVRGTKGSIASESKNHSGATYIQAGLWAAYELFEAVPDSDIIIGENNWQTGEYRMPIVVLMSDGAPTLGASNFADVKNQTYGRYNYSGANVGDGNDRNITPGQGFLVQLTASYIKNRIENKYKVNAEGGAGRSLFYTLGFNLDSISNSNAKSIAMSVMNPDNSTVTDQLWSTYNAASSTMQITVENSNSSHSNVTITKNSYVTGKSYVDEYFSASGTGLEDAFKDIVDEIILQSRYYPTHLEGGNPDFAGYVEFTDTLGEHIEVKHINGILLGDTLYDGHMMASKLADTSANGLGTPENPTELGDEFIRSIRTRIGITNVADAQALVAKAFADGQLRYNSASDWSNYIAWYAKADGTYAGFYDEDGTEPVPNGAVYIIRSYGFLGETTGSIKNSDMMYMTVQVCTNIETGKQTVKWKIPAALVPMITYNVSLTGTNIDAATDVRISVENADSVAPIRLIYETGLQSDLNPFNITSITGDSIGANAKTDEGHIADDGHTRLFWNNSFDITAASHDNHITALAEFTPNKENERFYYTFDSAVFKKSGNSYVLVGQNETLDENGEYYHRRYVFNSNSTLPVFEYEKMSKASINAAGWKDSFQTLDGSVTGAYVVPKGTPARELEMYSEHKATNTTNSAGMVFYPYMTEQNNIVYVDMNLGNNGLLSVTPETGIKISKTVDTFEAGSSDTFKFRLNTSASGSIETWVTDLDVTPTGAGTTVNLTNGAYEFTLKKDQTLWISGIPAGTTYMVQEISDNADYKVKSVHVNGVSTGIYATGTVSQYLIDDVDFVNTAIGEGNLFITKRVVDVNGNVVDVNDAVKFTAEITLLDRSGNPVSGTFASTAGNITFQNGKYTATLTDGASFVIRGIPEMTQFSVTETNVPAGFAFDSTKSSLSGVIDNTANDEALIVNTYDPTMVNGQGIYVEISKQISGNRTQWLAGESYTFNLERLGFGGMVIDTTTIDSNSPSKNHLFQLSGEHYAEPGNYYYRIYEVAGTQGGITYDSADRRFCVTVADGDLDGDLEIVSVTNEVNTVVSGQWFVSANFNNVYAPTGSATATVNVQKEINGNHALSGYQFALYDADPATNAEANVIVKSALTDSTGKAAIQITFSAEDAGNTYTYYLAELNRGETINNVKYSTAVYKVMITVTDNLDGTVSTETLMEGLPAGTFVPTFTNEYIPSASDYVTISGKKVIDGDRILNADEFAFQIEAVTAGAPMPAQTVVKNAADGSFQFPAIEYVHTPGIIGVKTYVYKITELADKKIGGFTKYDDTVYTVTVTVLDDGTTVTAKPVINNGTANVSDIVFTNTYDATDATVKLTGTKILTGKKLTGGYFEFVITRVTENAPMPFQNAQTNSTSNDANGLIDFGTLTFNKKGVYVYTITETDLRDNRYDCDASVYTLTVTVTDNSQGVLTAKTALTKDGMPSGEIVFRNGFTPDPISHDLHAKFGAEGVKVLEGRQIVDGEFSFVLINAINGAQVGDPVTNDANGKFKFPAVQITTPGIHHYKIVEVAGDAKGVTYDNTALHIRLEVIQDDNGILKVIDEQLHKGVVTKQEVGGVLTEVTTYENITANGTITFTNTYRADETHIAFEATKVLTGRDLVDGEFKFDLHKTDATYAYSANTLVQDDVVLKLEDNGTGKILFQQVKFDAAGTYYFAIVEDEQDAKGVKADRTVHKIEVTVVDDQLGNLVATLKVNGQTLNGSTADAVKFQNIYAAAATEIKIAGKKVLNGRELVAEEFSFELYDANNKLIETVKNAADGSFSFTAIPVDKAGEYIYTVCEQQGSVQGVAYDTARYTVKVTVTDNLDGTFKVVYSYLNGSAPVDGVSFTNIYTAPTPPSSNPQTSDTVNPVLLIVILAVSGLGFAATMFFAFKKKKNKE